MKIAIIGIDSVIKKYKNIISSLMSKIHAGIFPLTGSKEKQGQTISCHTFFIQHILKKNTQRLKFNFIIFTISFHIK